MAGKKDAKNKGEAKAKAPQAPAKLQIEDMNLGDGPQAKEGDTISVLYTGRFPGGAVFDSHQDRKNPISFPLKRGSLIEGWIDGIAGMKVGGKRKLLIPPHLGYGERGAGGGRIPPNATLEFEVELMGVGGR